MPGLTLRTLCWVAGTQWFLRAGTPLLDAAISLQMVVRFLKRWFSSPGSPPGGQVLDISSVQGRMALPLTGFLSAEGNYTGLEIVKSSVDWCEQVYVAHENFTFHHADVFNSYYNPEG